MKDLIFESDNLKAFYVTGGNVRQDERMAVTFRSLINPGRPNDAGESENTIRRVGIDAIHVIPKSNRWYQYPETHELLDSIRSIAATYDQVITYGLSMGGFAALQASAALNADWSVTYSPQFSVDSSRLGFVEKGWQKMVEGVDFIWDSHTNISRECRHYVVYDPRHTDGKHAAEIAKYVTIEPVLLPFAGHHTWRTAKHAGIGDKLLRGLLKGHLNSAWVRRNVRASRKTDARYFVNLWRQSSRSPWALERAIELDPLVTMMNLTRSEWPAAVEYSPDVWADARTAISALKASGKTDDADKAEATLERIHRRGDADDV